LKEGGTRMKITFPNLGNSYLAAKSLFDDLDIEYVMPSPSNKMCLELGSLNSPEEMCLPFKIMLGNYINSIEKGADTVIITGSCGPCRYGEYCELQINTMKRLGYDLNFIVVDSPFDIGKDEFLQRISKISTESQRSTSQKLNALKNAFTVINLIDQVEKKARYLAGFEINKGECKKILQECRNNALLCKSGKEMITLLKGYLTRLKNLKIDKARDPIKISIIGEIYTLLEPFSNLYIEDKLMDYGVSTTRGLYPSWWVKNTAMLPLKLNSIDIRLASRKYLPYYIGGHGRECIGEAVLAYKHGFDGAIQVFPMGCMPEIVSKSILPSVSRDNNFPIMTLIVDEMTGEAGYVTRIEAFLDLLERRKEHVLSRN
jgi:predicted nucleotide-binding protein (sugar kinase/HSP70/actin superfamily)